MQLSPYLQHPRCPTTCQDSRSHSALAAEVVGLPSGRLVAGNPKGSGAWDRRPMRAGVLAHGDQPIVYSRDLSPLRDGTAGLLRLAGRPT
jgi:hypothetical protein